MKKIMVADDDVSILDCISMILEIGGYEVTTMTNGKVLRTMKTELPNALLLDVTMSGEDGREICKLLKSQEETKHIPVIMISANSNVEISAKAAGADDFIAKPFDMQNLLNKIAEYTKD